MENHGLTALLQETVGESLINIRFKYDYSVSNDYVGGHENKDMIWYRWKFIGLYLLLEWCMFRWIHITAGGSEQYKGYEK